jgi:hypothetical protein
VNRILGAVVAIPFLVAPLAVGATPSPSPSLDTVLVAPSDSAFVDDPNVLAFPEGIFTAPQWAAVAGTSAPQMEDTLHKDGFITGYARAWLDKAHNHILTQAVVALDGGQGAARLQSYFADTVTSAKYYSHSISVSGIASAAGAHFANPAGPVYSDQMWFTKGNDYFYLATISPADDLGDLATTQIQRQFDVAPKYTIPPDQWPENLSSGGFDWASVTGHVALIAVAVAAVAVVVVVAAVVFLSRQRPVPAAAYAPMSTGVQMSQDGSYWWDGGSWRDASREAPPSAQRSSDGYYWWDGRAWRPVPQQGGGPPS